jgi:hypothetical protein
MPCSPQPVGWSGSLTQSSAQTGFMQPPPSPTADRRTSAAQSSAPSGLDAATNTTGRSSSNVCSTKLCPGGPLATTATTSSQSAGRCVTRHLSGFPSSDWRPAVLHIRTYAGPSDAGIELPSPERLTSSHGQSSCTCTAGFEHCSRQRSACKSTRWWATRVDMARNASFMTQSK